MASLVVTARRLERAEARLGPESPAVGRRTAWDWYAASCPCRVAAGECRVHPRARAFDLLYRWDRTRLRNRHNPHGRAVVPGKTGRQAPPAAVFGAIRLRPADCRIALLPAVIGPAVFHDAPANARYRPDLAAVLESSRGAGLARDAGGTTPAGYRRSFILAHHGNDDRAMRAAFAAAYRDPAPPAGRTAWLPFQSGTPLLERPGCIEAAQVLPAGTLRSGGGCGWAWRPVAGRSLQESRRTGAHGESSSTLYDPGRTNAPIIPLQNPVVASPW
jgi:hypothetical protein